MNTATEVSATCWPLILQEPECACNIRSVPQGLPHGKPWCGLHSLTVSWRWLRCGVVCGHAQQISPCRPSSGHPYHSTSALRRGLSALSLFCRRPDGSARFAHKQTPRAAKRSRFFRGIGGRSPFPLATTPRHPCSHLLRLTEGCTTCTEPLSAAGNAGQCHREQTARGEPTCYSCCLRRDHKLKLLGLYKLASRKHQRQRKTCSTIIRQRFCGHYRKLRRHKQASHTQSPPYETN